MRKKDVLICYLDDKSPETPSGNVFRFKMQQIPCSLLFFFRTFADNFRSHTPFLPKNKQ